MSIGRKPAALILLLALAVSLTGCANVRPAAPPTPTDVEAALMDEGKRLVEDGDIDGAVSLLEQGLSGAPTSPHILFALGNAYAQAQRLDDAERVYRQVLEQQPNDPDALSNLGFVLYQARRFGEALELFEKALKLQPDDAEILYNLGATLLAQGRVSEAVRRFEAARSADPELPQVYLGLGFAYTEQGEEEKAAESLRRFLEFPVDSAWKAQAEQALRALEEK
ncbi:MAG: tetratricopeptide repeat protein [Chloroflexi bacterium]|nr:tetratricopeptide repeat protein [Chloroflexota bacterium]